jgi:DNA invertase Pin-like site-specific DNA recombinase
MSSGKQEASPSQQRDAIANLANKHNCRVIREYYDDAISGDDTAKRKSFQQMVADAEKLGDFQVILCWDQDRFGRFDSIEAGRWIYPLREAGVRLITVAQGQIDWNDFAGRLVYSIQQEAKHQFLRDLARNSLRGLIARVKQGLWPGGTAPYGYEIDDAGRLILGDPQEVATVREIFRMRLEGLGYRVLAHKLNQTGIAAPSGGKWSHDAVRLILNREAYCGVVTLGGRRQGKYFTASNDEVTPVIRGIKGKTTATRFENAHPAIIDPDTFHAGQALQKTHPKAHCRGESEGAPLAGLLHCGYCGSVMYAQSLQRKSGQRFPNYVWGTYHKGHGCGYCVVPQDGVLTAVVDTIREKVLLGSEDALLQFIKEALRVRGAQECQQTESKDVLRRITALDKQISQATDRLVNVDESLVPLVEQKLLDLRKERAALQEQIRPQQASAKTPDAQQIAANIWRFDALLRNGSPAQVRNALSKMVERVTLEFEPRPKNKRGQSYRFVKGKIAPCTKPCAPLATCR